MISTTINEHTIRLQRRKNKQWPQSAAAWAATCGYPGREPTSIKFEDGAFIAEFCEVYFGPPLPSRVMLDKWAACIDDRRKIMEFWEWLTAKHEGEDLIQLNIEKLIDEFHGIDQAQLEKERRALLEQHVKTT